MAIIVSLPLATKNCLHIINPQSFLSIMHASSDFHLAIHAFIKAYNTRMGILIAAEWSPDIVSVCSASVRNWATESLEAMQKCQMDEDLI